MRQFSRTPAPEIIQQNAAKWNEQWATRKRETPSASFNWYQHQNRSVREWILQDLALMTQEHCSFCDGYHIEPETIEHFMPKSHPDFLHLAYEWTNLYYCCGGCQGHKIEDWDPPLLRPDADDFQFERYFSYDFATGAISPNDAASPRDQLCAETTIKLYGLDSDRRRKFRREAKRIFDRSEEKNLDLFGYRNFVGAAESAEF